MTIECADAEDLGHYARAAIMQEHYKHIKAVKIEDEMCQVYASEEEVEKTKGESSC
jgi:hypothetical protein